MCPEFGVGYEIVFTETEANTDQYRTNEIRHKAEKIYPGMNCKVIVYEARILP